MSFASSISSDFRERLRSLTLDRQLRVLRLLQRGHAPSCVFVMGSQFSGICRCRLDQGHCASPAKKAKRKAVKHARRANR